MRLQMHQYWSTGKSRSICITQTFLTKVKLTTVNTTNILTEHWSGLKFNVANQLQLHHKLVDMQSVKLERDNTMSNAFDSNSRKRPLVKPGF